MKSPISRHIECPDCGCKVKLPFIWIIGIESIFICGRCKRKLRTGYKMGAVLFGISLALAIAAANIAGYILPSKYIPLTALLILPLWIFNGYVLRRFWLVKVSVRKNRKSETSRKS